MRFFMSLLAAGALTAAALAQDAPPSPSCDLLTEAEATEVLGHKVMSGGSTAEMAGTSSCGWVDTENFNAISIGLMRAEALAGVSAEETVANQKNMYTSMGTVEDLADLGAAAFLLAPTGSPEGTYMVSIGKNGSVVGINVSGVPKDKTIAAAKLIAGKL